MQLAPEPNWITFRNLLGDDYTAAAPHYTAGERDGERDGEKDGERVGERGGERGERGEIKTKRVR